MSKRPLAQHPHRRRLVDDHGSCRVLALLSLVLFVLAMATSVGPALYEVSAQERGGERRVEGSGEPPSSESPSSAARAAEAVGKVAVLVPLSGRQKRLGQAVLDAITLAQVSWSGVEVVLGDTRGSAEHARREMVRLAADPTVLAVLGPLGWEEGRAAAESAQQLGLTNVGLSAQEGLERLGPYVFRGRPSIEAQSRWMARFAVNEMQFERLAILHPDDDLGKRAATAFFESARLSGGRVTSLASYKAGETNLQKAVEALVAKRSHVLAGRDLSRPPRTRVRKVKRASRVDFEAVFIPDYDDAVALSTRYLAFHDVGLSNMGIIGAGVVQILGTSQMHGPRLADTDGLISGALYPELFDPNGGDDASAAFGEAFRDAYERDPVDLDAQVVDLYAVLTDAVAHCATLSGDVTRRRRCVSARLVTMEPYPGLTGEQWFEEDGAPGREFQVWVVGGGGDVSPSY